VTDEAPQPAGEEHASLVRPFLRGGPVQGEREETTDPLEAGVRPFLVTSGRTVGAGDLPIEAQVVVTAVGRGARASLTFEYRDIVSLCDEPLALAEIAAKLSLHLGVIRVLIGDLRHQGMVTTFEPTGDVSDDVETIMRVIDGLRQLS
jgi:hypothetical protein